MGFSTLLFTFGLGWRDFWAPVEPRYAEIVRVMFATNEWVVPRVNGNLYTDKPILYFWLALMAAKFSGAVNEWTVRLPAAMGGVGFVLTTYVIGRDFLNAGIGFIGAVILATSMRVIWEARWAHVDMLFCCWFTLAVYFAMRGLLRRGRPNEILLAYLFMALATLTKGLIGVVLPALLLGSFILVRRDWHLIRAVKLHWGLPLYLLVAGPWFFLVDRATDGRWLSDFLYLHHFQRYTSGAGHRQPFYYYFTTLPVDLLPWTIFALPALFAFRSYQRIRQESVLLFLSLWFLTVFLFFTASDTKRELYLLPLLPPAALWLGNYFDALVGNGIPENPLHRWFVCGGFAAVAVIGVAFPVAAWIMRREMFWLSLPGSLVLAIGGALTVRFLRRRQPLQTVVSVALMMTLALGTAALWILPYLERFKSRRPFAMQIKQTVPAAAPLYVYADTMNDFNFYLQREVIPVVSSREEVAKLLNGTQTSYILIKDRDLKKLTMLAARGIMLRNGAGTSTWNLVEIKTRPRADLES